MTQEKIALKEVRHVARLAHIDATDQDLEAMRADLNAILDYVAQLETLDLEGVAPTTHAVPLELPLRPDLLAATLTRDEVLAGAPDQDQGMFRVPRIVEGGN